MEKLHFSVALVISSIFSGNFLNFNNEEIMPVAVDRAMGKMEEKF